jgi:hypothetical protein
MIDPPRCIQFLTSSYPNASFGFFWLNSMGFNIAPWDMDGDDWDELMRRQIDGLAGTIDIGWYILPSNWRVLPFSAD